MHIQEILNAIYANHLYEYLVIDKNYRVIEYSDKVFELCQKDDKANVDYHDIQLMDMVPELVGKEEEIIQIFQGNTETFTLPYVHKNSDQYVHIHVHPGRETAKEDKNSSCYETVIILFENISRMAAAQQSLIQERNEKSLLLNEISEKNMQLKHMNDHMQMLVEEEIEKNLEKQKLLELKSRHSQMGEMIAMITHQWKQPLNVINLIVNVLKIDLTKQNLRKKDIEKKLNDIFRQVRYMDQTINDFQNFFNPYKKKIIFNLHENIQSVLDLVKYEYMHKNIKLQLTGETDTMAYGFPNEFNQVILTLLKNAKDAFIENAHNEMMITIDITTGTEGKPIITVTDNAGGIAENIIDQIFDLYVTTKEDGSGLGLNIAKNMIEKHMNGNISIENIDNGARFYIMLPPPSATL